MKSLLFMLTIISLYGCNDQIGTYKFCGKAGNEVFCADYSLDLAKFVGDFKPSTLEALDGAMCIPREEFLTRLKPRLKEIRRQKVDTKKKRIKIDGYMNVRNDWNL